MQFRYRSRIRAFDWCQNQRPWMTLKGHYAFYAPCLKTRASFGVHHENLNEDRLYCQRQRRRCSAVTLDSDNIRFTRIRGAENGRHEIGRPEKHRPNGTKNGRDEIGRPENGRPGLPFSGLPFSTLCSFSVCQFQVCHQSPQIFAGVPWKGGVIQQWGNRKRVFLAFGRYVFGTLGNEANVRI